MTEREHPRVPYAVRVEFRTTSSFLVAYSINLSRGGIFLETDHEAEVGSEVELQVALPDADPIPMNGRVTWRREEPDEDGMPGIGIEFEELSEALGSIVDGLVTRYAGLSVVLVCHSSQDRSSLSRQIRSILSTAEVVEAAESHLAETLLGEGIDLLIVDADYDPDGACAVLRRAKDLAPPVPSVALATAEEVRGQVKDAGADEAIGNPPPFADFRRLIVRALSRPSSVK